MLLKLLPDPSPHRMPMLWRKFGIMGFHPVFQGPEGEKGMIGQPGLPGFDGLPGPKVCMIWCLTRICALSLFSHIVAEILTHWPLGNLNEFWICNFKWILVIHGLLKHLVWNCPNMNVTGFHWWSVNIGSGDGTKWFVEASRVKLP